jgi:hypothetical protein
VDLMENKLLFYACLAGAFLLLALIGYAGIFLLKLIDKAPSSEERNPFKIPMLLHKDLKNKFMTNYRKDSEVTPR